MTFPDAYILERRLRQLERLPWPIPAAVLLEMTEEDFDALDMAEGRGDWWATLNRVVARISEEQAA